MSAGQTDGGVVNSLDVLAPKFRDAVIKAIADCRANGLDAIVHETYRSQELQALYYARGRTVTPPADTVTNAASNLYSWHGFGLAVDVISEASQWNQPDAWFASVAEYFRAAGCRWGGEWTVKDLPHFQWAACKPSPSDEARSLLVSGGMRAVWEAAGAI